MSVKLPPAKVKQKYVDSLDPVSKARYVQKCSLIDKRDPYEIPKAEWKHVVGEWPDVQYGDIFNYLVNTVSAYTKDEMRGYKGLDSYNQFVCGWVKEIRNVTVGDKCLIAALVRHSQRMNDVPLHPWLVAEPTGNILAAHCDCMAGLGEVCSHVGALLFAIEAAVKIRDSKTVTQEKSYWMLPTAIQKVQYSRISAIDFTSAKTKKRKLDEQIEGSVAVTPKTPRTQAKCMGPIPPPSKEENEILFNRLKVSGRKPVILATTPGYSSAYIPEVLTRKYPLVLTELRDENYFATTKEVLHNHCEQVFSEISVSEEEAENVESLTREQSKNKHWFRFRAGRITASKVKAVCRTPVEKPSQSLLKSICYPNTCKFKAKQTEWGCKHESVARERYRTMMKETHQKFDIVETGLILNPKYPYLGASPDGVAMCDCCGEVCVEIKCPYCKRNDSLRSNEDKSCLQEDNDGNLSLKKTHEYYYQVQCQLLVSEKEYCDFIVWTNVDFHCERISTDHGVQSELIQKSKMFFIKVVLPELVARVFSQLATTPTSEDVSHSASSGTLQSINVPALPTSNQNVGTSNGLVICTCRAVYNADLDNVIGCDNQNCPYQWLHYKCAKIKKVPKGRWLCAECRRLSKKS